MVHAYIQDIVCGLSDCGGRCCCSLQIKDNVSRIHVSMEASAILCRTVALLVCVQPAFRQISQITTLVQVRAIFSSPLICLRISPSGTKNKIKNPFAAESDRCANSWGLCSQMCVNSEDSSGYRCQCYPGFQLSADHFSCHSQGTYRIAGKSPSAL